MLIIPVLNPATIIESMHANITGIQTDVVTVVVGMLGIAVVIFGLSLIKIALFENNSRSEDDVVIDWDKANTKRLKADKIRKREGLI